MVVPVLSFLLCPCKTACHAPEGVRDGDLSRIQVLRVPVVRRRSEEVQVAARHRLERLESALQALGETESTVAQGLNAASKEARAVQQHHASSVSKSGPQSCDHFGLRASDEDPNVATQCLVRSCH